MTPSAELQYRQVEAAAQLVELAVEDSNTVEQLMAELAARLAQECREAADATRAARSPDDMAMLRTQFVRRVAGLMVDTSRRLADVGGATRARFSRLLTERLASGNPELLDAYQSFFRVLPPQNPDAVTAMQHALLRSERAVDDALRLITPQSSACEPPLRPSPAPAGSPSAA
ncbi:MAG TPA: phasin family protein [Rhodocyclaceae bacterium]